MRIQSWESFVEDGERGRFSATIGVFDGLHIGHQALISKILARGQQQGSIVFTFKENPKKVLHPARFQGDLVSLGRKLALLETLEIERVVLIDFSGDFSKMPGRNFLSLVLERGGLSFMAVGSDFHCGKDRDVDSKALKAFFDDRGVEVEIVEPVSRNGVVVSSTRIRSAIHEGRIAEAATMLGRNLEVELGEETSGQDGLRRFQRPRSAILPPPGLYRVLLVEREGIFEGTLRLGAEYLELEGPVSSDPVGLPRVELLDIVAKRETKR